MTPETKAHVIQLAQEQMQINVREWVGENAMTQDDGKAVYDLIHDPLRQGETVELDFEGVDVFASPFFNASVGRLLEDLGRDALNARLRFEHLSAFGERVLRSVIENAKTIARVGIKRRFAATIELQRPAGGAGLPTIPICPICGNEAQEHADSGGTVYRCYWHGDCEPQWIVDEEQLAGDSK